MYKLFFLLFLAAVCAQVNSECLDTGGVSTAIKEWIEDKLSAEIAYGPIADWKFCIGTTFKHLLYGDGNWKGSEKAMAFNEDLSSWDTSFVTSMVEMFSYAKSFNRDISGWDTSGVKNMSWMFHEANSFNQNMSGWDTASVTDMSGMFWKATSFNYNISEWDTSGVTDMYGMFYEATYFNQDLSNWDTLSVTNMLQMFYAAISFNKDITGWDTTRVTSMKSMFNQANSFNQDISGWSTAGVKTMYRMFFSAASFETCLVWDISNVQYTSEMFSGSNGDICTSAPTMTAPPAKITPAPSSLPTSYPSPALRAHSIDSTDNDESVWIMILPYVIALGICFSFLIYYFVHTTFYKKTELDGGLYSSEKATKKASHADDDETCNTGRYGTLGPRFHTVQGCSALSLTLFILLLQE
uniref:BspA family leucine-rich repeat surface protein n=2 Tax=Corethron hystrix TaxID=216773 RepID=A0A7S1B3I8_9STRA|mmetsp:Transcript_11577/g.25356  ORF Transcript_11577/g.25356 Transcript_11577/m.25356 type:complete len:411 (+) Transcript_11577:330-1562(+)